jgi:hypothetical protein
VQDASYLVTVPLIAEDTPHLRRDPIVAYMCDLFTRPYPLVPHIVRDIEADIDTIVRMLACHQSQMFEWLPYNLQCELSVPSEPAQRLVWLRDWYGAAISRRADRFRGALVETYGENGSRARYVEAFEISEYATPLTPDKAELLFPR